MKIAETHIAIIQKTPIRFQEYAVGIFKSISTKSGVKKAIKKKLICIDGKNATTSKYIYGGEKIELFKQATTTKLKSLRLKIEVLFEDNYIAILYKPAGILVNGNKFVTLKNALPQNLQISTAEDAVSPQPVHRLDYPTSGLLLVGKTSTAIQKLSKLFENKEIEKTYYAITIGQMCLGGIINIAIDGKKAATEFKVIESEVSKRFGYLNLVKLTPKTGRKHQLRKHLASVGHQILGDKTYGDSNLILKGKGLYLHAYQLSFSHPFTNRKIIVSKNPPKKFANIFPSLQLLITEQRH